MANGEEDLHEKNKYRQKPVKNSRYTHWNSSFGEEDAQMLIEKSSGWNASKHYKEDYDES